MAARGRIRNWELFETWELHNMNHMPYDMEVPSIELDRFFVLLRTICGSLTYVFTTLQISEYFHSRDDTLWVSDITPEFLRSFRRLVIPNIVEYVSRGRIYSHCVVYKFLFYLAQILGY
jgi:hypothetical protein